MDDVVEMSRISWPAYRDRLANGAIVIVPVGALEQHGHHLPLGVDGILAGEIARRVARRVDGLVARTIDYGYKSQPRTGGGDHFPGTTSRQRHVDRGPPRCARGSRPSRSPRGSRSSTGTTERDVPDRGRRPRVARDAVPADRRRADPEAPALRGGRPGDDRVAVA